MIKLLSEHDTAVEPGIPVREPETPLRADEDRAGPSDME